MELLDSGPLATSSSKRLGLVRHGPSLLIHTNACPARTGAFPYVLYISTDSVSIHDHTARSGHNSESTRRAT